jgi:hypothetical protein
MLDTLPEDVISPAQMTITVPNTDFWAKNFNPLLDLPYKAVPRFVLTLIRHFLDRLGPRAYNRGQLGCALKAIP